MLEAVECEAHPPDRYFKLFWAQPYSTIEPTVQKYSAIMQRYLHNRLLKLKLKTKHYLQFTTDRKILAEMRIKQLLVLCGREVRTPVQCTDCWLKTWAVPSE